MDHPRVLAVLVVHEGVAWLAEVLDALARQTWPHLRIVAVDNGSTDGSRDLLLERLPADDLLVAERDLGFGAAVSMALDAVATDPAEYVVLVHDDLVLADDAVERLVTHAEADPRLAAVAPKLVHWDDPGRLGEVGLSVDLTGRVASDVEPDERDQGQRDVAGPVLYASSAGLLLRRGALEHLGRFDRRYHLFRESLDWCWRAWLAGYEVEIAPAATGRHRAAASNYERLGQTAFIGPRYFAERNTLATLLKNYQALRLLWLVPLYFAVGTAKLLGFFATRRLADAWQTVRAWLWNLVHLRRTLALRRATQALRVRGDRELRPLFAQTAPRVRAYVEAVAEWASGGELAEIEDPAVTAREPRPAGRRLVDFVGRHPLLVGGGALAVAGVVAAVPLLGGGQLRGGDLAPWPEDSLALLRGYANAWHGGAGLGSSGAPSPAQALLGLLGLVTGGHAWLAQRALVLLPVPLAWLLAVWAAGTITPSRPARLAAATAYAASPPVIAALAQGRVGALVVAAALPALVVAGATFVRTDVAPTRAWRAAAAGALVAAAAVAFEPPVALVLGLAVLLAVLVLVSQPGELPGRRGALLRLLAFTLGVLLLLFPWSVDLFRPGTPALDSFNLVTTSPTSFWRWLLLAVRHGGTLGVLGGVGLLVAGLVGLGVAGRHRPVLAPSLWALALSGIFAAWLAGRAGGDAWVWPGVPLLVAAAALAGLLAAALGATGEVARHAFGWRQIGLAAAVVAVLVGVGASVSPLYTGGWDAYARATPALPRFLEAQREEVGPFRVLVASDDGDTVEWDLTGPEGPDLRRYGAPRPEALLGLVGGALAETLSHSDPGAAARLGMANVRYVVVPERGRSAPLEAALQRQIALEPRPVDRGLVFRVADWVPRVAYAPTRVADVLDRRGELPPGSPQRLEPYTAAGTRYVGRAPGPGTVLVAEVAASGWRAEADGRPLTLGSDRGLARFRLDAAADRVVVRYASGGRPALVGIEAFVFALTLSLLLRPPRFAVTREERVG